MSTALIVLIILGLIFIFSSYFLSSKIEEEKDEEEIIKIPEELTEEQKAKIKKLIDDYMDENIDNKLVDIESKLSEITNQKTLALGDYAVTVNEEIERNHNEVMFLYSMLSDKQKEIMNLTNEVDSKRKNMEEYINETNQKIQDTTEDWDEAIKEIDEQINEKEEENVESVDGGKDIILQLHKSGLSILEIAKQLGLGVGEVKLVVDLYKEQ